MSHAPHVGYPTPPPIQKQPRKRGLIWAGVICMGLAVVIGVLALFFAFRPVIDAAPQLIDGPTTVQVERAGTYAVYLVGGGSTDGECQVLGPDGAQRGLQRSFGSQRLTVNGQVYVVHRTFEALEGPHQVSCEERAVEFAVGREVNLFGVAWLALVGVFGGIALFVIGLILLIVGLVKR